MRIPLGDRVIGDGAACLVVAAVGSNHDGDLSRAEALIDAAAAARVDAVSFDSFTAPALLARRFPAPGGGWQPAPGYPALEQRALPAEWYAGLRAYAIARGLLFLATPFDETRATLLAALGVQAMAVAPGDITHLPLLERLGTFGRPLLLATGLAPAGDVVAALAAIDRGAGAPARRPPVVLVAGPAVSSAGILQASVRRVETLRVCHDCLTGWSDCVSGTALALGAVARGACLVEKPITDDRMRPGAHHTTALEPGELAAFVGAVREIEAALGDATVEQRVPEAERRSVFAARPLPAGTALTLADLKVVRPGIGLPPATLSALIGRRLVRALAEDEPIATEDCA